MLRSWIARTLGGTTPGQPVCPDAPFYAIGDIHGRLDLLQQLLDLLDPEIPVFCLGDYIDRGENSAAVLRLLHRSPAITCLLGNHEVMLLDFLDNPVSRGPNWLRNGGLQTLASFGVTGIAGLSESAGGAGLEQARDGLGTAMGEALIAWLRDLATFRITGNVAIVHAGADPAIPIIDQHRDVLVWGHPDFTKSPRADGLWVVHGHTIVSAPMAKDGRISIDTGAYATGHLTAARIAGDGVSFIST